MIRIEKKKRQLTVLGEDGSAVMKAAIALGWAPEGPKRREGDGKTPEGVYTLCLTKANGRHGQSLGLSYPGVSDADLALAEGRIDPSTHQAIQAAHRQGIRPPWGSPLGGEIYIHAGGTARDWTQGCIALEEADMARLFALAGSITRVEILP
ncbi:MAG: murein L,D-transpeptidase [Clostridiales bacterium]|nr:murein L,D-transpeptidase [Clostridiales bacterium]